MHGRKFIEQNTYMYEVVLHKLLIHMNIMYVTTRGLSYDN